MNTQTSDHLKSYNSLIVDILTIPGNTTSYIIRQTQGAEYGDEAEAVRQIFEAAINSVFCKEVSEIDAQCEECDWKGGKDEMDMDDEANICPDCGSDKIYYLK